MSALGHKRPLVCAAAAAVAALAGGCGGGALDPQGQGAEAISALWWVMFLLSLIPLAIVLGMMARIVAARRRERAGEDRPVPERGDDRHDRRVIVLGGIVLPVAVLLPVIAMTMYTTQAREPDDGPQAALEIAVTGHQFWWDLRYPAPGSDRIGAGSFRTANELHIPVGRPVELRLRSEDVIHSIWIPEIDGKMDLIPGRVNTLRVQADEPGVFEARCAEFCGAGHALMRLVVVAHEQGEFEAWHDREAAPADVDVDTGVRQEFANSCGVCHDVRGVYERRSFRGDFGPDLTHLASRRTIGAGLLPNTREALGRWIVDPEGVKPGNRMPDVGLDGEALADVVDFLEELR